MSEYSIAVLISGGGTTLRNLIDRRESGLLAAKIELVVSSNPNAKGLKFADAAGIEAVVIDHHDFPNAGDLSNQIFDLIRAKSIALVVCGGFLRRLRIPVDFVNRVINIHPSLIPDFSGRGMYGLRVHAAVIAAGARESGCTVHFVDDEFDHGPIIAQRKVAVQQDDTPESLAARVFRTECDLYPNVINRFANGEIVTGIAGTTRPQAPNR